MKRIALYNPFDRLTEEMMQYSVLSGEIYWIIQRFQWPGVAEQKGFIASRYATEADAIEHAQALQAGEGKMLNITLEAEKVKNLIQPESGYHLFMNTLQKDWEKRLKAAFKDKFIAYIRMIHFAGKGPVDIILTLEYGRVMIAFQNEKGESASIPIYKILKT